MRSLKSVVLLVVLTSLLSCNKNKEAPQRETASQSSPSPPVPKFDGENAFKYLQKQVSFGPRNPGSAGYQRCLSFLQTEFRKFADTLILQRFPFRTARGEFYRGTNITAQFRRHDGPVILLTAHWDTRPWADQDTDPKNHDKPIPGANDGASGVALLLEMARIFSVNPPPFNIDIVLFDAEDAGETGKSESFALGSQFFASNLPDGIQYRFAINFDMIGDKNLEIRREANSDASAPALMDAVFSTAKILGFPQFIDERIAGIYDDHMPLNNAHIPAIDLIDFNYPDESNKYWHTMQDTPDKCSPESLHAVGTVILHLLYGQGTERL
ncbi:MAG: M28 family peptidase [Ignavibacteriales bacterium]|nr:M28 family peptidase [Ignavibacteriales bacterium]